METRAAASRDAVTLQLGDEVVVNDDLEVIADRFWSSHAIRITQTNCL
ncbi:hypothetical protein [Frankia sp. Cr2]|nr:hypothetical protein [Frankia sp. Cr2]